jgi:hypothetical protein
VAKILEYAMRVITLGILLTIAPSTAAGQNKQYPKGDLANIYSNASLGFHYTPPSGMRDQTELLRSQIQEDEGATGTTLAHKVLLAMFSREEGSGPNWRSLTIETYPRSAIPDPDDASAEAKISAWLAHSEDASPSSNKSAIISGQRFSISVFALQDGPVRKGAVVWTTIRKGQLLSFFFAANSPQQLTVLAESMKSVKFF